MSKYGLIGKSLAHSHSKQLHELIAANNRLNLTYDYYECLDEEALKTCINLLRNGTIKGFNVTIPYKEKIIEFCDKLSPAASTIKAVNTLYMKDGYLIGDNTDHVGFKRLLSYYHINPKGRTSYVLGSGGAGKACLYALNQLESKAVLVTRDKVRHQGLFKFVIDYDVFNQIGTYPLVINTTPVGMYPNVLACPLKLEVASQIDVVVDLIYNPKKTNLMKHASFAANGLVMLIAQAIKSQEIWQEKELKNSDTDISDLIGGLEL